MTAREMYCHKCNGPVILETWSDGSQELTHDGRDWSYRDKVSDFRYCDGDDSVEDNFLYPEDVRP